MEPGACLDENQVAELLARRLSARDLSALQRHADACPDCYALLTAAADYFPADSGDAATRSYADPARAETEAAQPSALAPLALPSSFDEYRLVGPLGSGGMGQVFAGHDTLLDRPVAIKFINGIDSPASRNRFLLESRAIARLTHPNVVSVYRAGQVDGRPYLVSELVRGRSLDRLALPLPWEEVLSIGVSLCRGLGAAHRRGVLHRDIKPGNVILSEDGEVKLLDFGLAKLLGDAAETVEPPMPAPPASAPALHLTRPGVLLGTPLYMSPEVFAGAPATVRSDLYSLGAMLYELAAGARPHDGRTLQEMEAALAREAPPLLQVAPRIEPRLGALIDRCLRRDPAERPASAEELGLALERIGGGAATLAVPEGNPFRGLHAFQAEHRGLFFGRDREVRTLIERLRADSLILVTGDSGIGKSSLCRAGVLPAVMDGALGGRRRFRTATMSPGRRPLSALAEALALHLGEREDTLLDGLRREPHALARRLHEGLAADRGLLLFVDQLEELVTQSTPEEAALWGEALGPLCGDAAGVRLLFTVRGDFLTRLSVLPGLGGEFERAVYILRPLSKGALREAVLGPVQRKGVSFESERMVDELVDSAARAGGGGLPLLQFALAELWEARQPDRGLIPEAALVTVGGVSGALARHADGALAALPATQRDAARRILITLVSGEGTRVRRGRAELLGPAEGDERGRAALDALVRGRLVVAREGEGPGAQEASYELAHEALLQGWDTLRGWLSQSAESRAAEQRLERAAEEWERLGRARDALFRARQLADVVRLDPSQLPQREAAFLRASRKMARAGWVRAALLVGLPFLSAVGYYGALRLNERRERQRQVAVLLGEAGSALSQAQRQTAESEELRRRAFALFDRAQAGEAEAGWERALARAEEAERSYDRAGQSAERAVLFDPGRLATRAFYGDLLYGWALLAERDHRPAQLRGLLGRLAVYDEDGSRRRRFAAPGALSIGSDPPGAEVTLFSDQRDAQGRRRQGAARALGRTPLGPVSLLQGSYVLALSSPRRAPVRYPVLIGRGEALSVSIPLPEEAAVPSGFAYVPPGRFLFGSADDEGQRQKFLQTAPMHEVRTEAYLIQRNETAWDEWLTYLRTLPPAERARRSPKGNSIGGPGTLELSERPAGSGAFHLAMQPTTRAYASGPGGRITYGARDRRQSVDWLRLPAAGIDLGDAQAYLAWLDRSGRVPGARLCTDHEWERAARGADDREFPHGDHMDPDDANIDVTYGKQPVAMGPDEVGSHPASASPFGVYDMAGNVWEWVSSSLVLGEAAIRGGSFYYHQNVARITNREVPEPGIRDLNQGLRVCASLRKE